MILIFRNPYKIGIIDLILEMKKLKFKEIKEFMHIIQWWGLSAESIHLALWLQSHCDKPLSNSSSLWLQSQCDKSLSNSSSCYKLTLGNPVNHANLTNGFFILPERKECLFLKMCLLQPMRVRQFRFVLDISLCSLSHHEYVQSHLGGKWNTFEIWLKIWCLVTGFWNYSLKTPLSFYKCGDDHYGNCIHNQHI